MSILIPSTHSPNTSFPIAITDAIGSSKSHRNLMPFVRDLVEPRIKSKRQLLLPRRYTLFLASLVSSTPVLFSKRIPPKGRKYWTPQEHGKRAVPSTRTEPFLGMAPPHDSSVIRGRLDRSKEDRQDDRQENQGA